MIRKRCPNGTRKNKKTGMCDPVLKKIPEKSISKSPTLIPVTTRPFLTSKHGIILLLSI